MKPALIALALGAGLVIGFLLGMLWRTSRFENAPVFTLTKSLTVQVSPGHLGSIPKGASLYEYRHYGEISTYCLSLVLKEINLPKGPKHETGMIPLDGYYEPPAK